MVIRSRLDSGRARAKTSLSSVVVAQVVAMIRPRATASCRSRRRKAQIAIPATAAYVTPGQVSSENAEAIWAVGDSGSSRGATQRASSAWTGPKAKVSQVQPTRATNNAAAISIEDLVGGRRTIVSPSWHRPWPGVPEPGCGGRGQVGSGPTKPSAPVLLLLRVPVRRQLRHVLDGREHGGAQGRWRWLADQLLQARQSLPELAYVPLAGGALGQVGLEGSPFPRIHGVEDVGAGVLVLVQRAARLRLSHRPSPAPAPGRRAPRASRPAPSAAGYQGVRRSAAGCSPRSTPAAAPVGGSRTVP